VLNIKLGMPTFEDWSVFGDALQVDNVGFNVGIQVIVLDAVNLDEIIIESKTVFIGMGYSSGVEAKGTSPEWAGLELDDRGIWWDE
jgi:hypothetical protein